MDKVPGGRQAMPLAEMIFAQAFQLKTLINVLERQGMLRKAEVLERIKALQAMTPTAR